MAYRRSFQQRLRDVVRELLGTATNNGGFSTDAMLKGRMHQEENETTWKVATKYSMEGEACHEQTYCLKAGIALQRAVYSIV